MAEVERRRTIAASLFAFACVACGQKGALYLPTAESEIITRPTQTPTTAAATTTGLAGSTMAGSDCQWHRRSTSATKDTPATVEFVDTTRVAFTGGCNRYASEYSVTGTDNLRFGKDFASTRKACAPDSMQQDEALAAALGGAAQLRQTTDTLVILAADGTELVTLRRQPPP